MNHLDCLTHKSASPAVTGVRSMEEPDISVVVCCWQFTLPGEMSVMLKVDILLSNTVNTRTFSSE